MTTRHLTPLRLGLAATLWLTACGSRSGLHLAIDGSSDGAEVGAGGGDGESSGGRNTGGRASGGGDTGGQASGGRDTGGQASGGQSSGGASGGEGGQASGGQGSGGQGSGGDGTGGGPACPEGFEDFGDGCQPILTDLLSNYGTVLPDVSTFEPSYLVRVPIWTEGLALFPYAVPSVTIDYEGQALLSGEFWRPPGFAPGTTLFTGLTLSASGYLSSNYIIYIERTGRVDYVKASNTGYIDSFGSDVAVSADGRTLAVGAWLEYGGTSGIGGDENDDSAPGAGAVYVFVRYGETWFQQAYIKASNAEADDEFGIALDLSADGNVLVVGAVGEASAAAGVDGDQQDNLAERSGAAYVFSRAAGAWQQEAYLKASNPDEDDAFGFDVALSDDGTTLAIGAPGEQSLATGVNGDQASNALEGAGAVYVFSRGPSGIAQEAYVKASNTGQNDSFGSSLALSADGSTLAVGADWEDSDATGVDGDPWNDGAALAGAVYVLSRTGTNWQHTAYVKATDSDVRDMFGHAVALSGDGSTLAVGARNEGSLSSGIDGDQTEQQDSIGAVYVLTRNGSTFEHQAYIKASNPHEAMFGHSVALSFDGDVLAVGAPWEDGMASGIDGDQSFGSQFDNRGAAYRFARAGSSWIQSAYVKPSVVDGGDLFASSVTLSADGSTLVASTPEEDSDARGMNGDALSDEAPSSGAAYVFAED